MTGGLASNAETLELRARMTGPRGDSRYEASDYQTVAIARLQDILDAIGVKTAVILTA